MLKPAENLPKDPAELRAMIVELQAENAKITATLRIHDQLVQALRLRIAKLQKLAFGKPSEKIEREIEQLELALENLLVAVAEDDDAPIDEGQDEPIPEEPSTPALRRRPRVSDATLRARRELDPGTCCPICGGDLRVTPEACDSMCTFGATGEDVSELLDMIAAQMEVIYYPLIKKSCRRCGPAGLVPPCCPRSGGSVRAPAPLGAVYRFAPNWKEEHVLSHLANARGILQADGYKGYAKLYVPEPGGVPGLREAACWAHLRRDFHDFWTSTKSGIAREALDRIGKLYDIERDINGQPADVSHAPRQKLSQQKVVAFFAWSEQQLLRIIGKSELAKAFYYPAIAACSDERALWPQSTRCLQLIPVRWPCCYRQQSR
jgi:hypothetical protein